MKRTAQQVAMMVALILWGMMLVCGAVFLYFWL